ncbi:MAG: hypothetical protein KJ838_04840, partial [Candidatus Omnitrophica bacterium]|nr:hypothetical protein [Candidatus Omnitrophota bacterium]
RLSKESYIANQMECFHRLSSIITLELSDFVSMLSIFVEKAEKNFAVPQIRNDLLANTSGTIAKLNSLLSRLSNLNKKIEVNRRPLNINILINETINKLCIEYNYGIKFLKLFDYIPQVAINAEHMQQVFRNLILNAVEAMPEGGSLTIKTSYHQGDCEFNAKYVQIICKDTGCGMAEEFIKQRLFKPFPNTKHASIGIGLFQCKTIVEAHGGRILVKSQKGKGSNFIIRLPVRNKEKFESSELTKAEHLMEVYF